MAYFGIVKSLPSSSGFGFIFILALALIGPNTKSKIIATLYVIYVSI